MISSPSLRSVPTLKSAESVSPSAGSAFWAATGRATPWPAIASAHSHATARRRRRGHAESRLGEETGEIGTQAFEGQRGAGRPGRRERPRRYDALESFPLCFVP